MARGGERCIEGRGRRRWCPPLIVEIVVPKLGMYEGDATLIEWLVDDGGAVAVGDPLFLVETDKIESEIEADDDGLLVQLQPPGSRARSAPRSTRSWPSSRRDHRRARRRVAAARDRPGRSPRRSNAMSTSLEAPTVELSFVESVGRTLAHVMRADRAGDRPRRGHRRRRRAGPPLEGSMGGSFGVTKGLLEEFGGAGCATRPSRRRRSRRRRSVRRWPACGRSST